MRNLVLCVLTVVALVACGEKNGSAPRSIKPTSAPYGGSEIADLVPADAAVVVRVSSLEKLEEIVGQLQSGTGQSMPSNPLMMSGIDPSQVDRSKPFAIAVTVSAGSPMPMPVYIVPVKDPKAVAAAHQGGGSATRGSYAAVSMNPNYKAGGSSLIGAMRPGDVSVRVDLKSVVSMYRANIDQATGFIGRMAKRTASQNAPGLDAQPIVQDVQAWMKDFLDSAEALDVVMNLDDGMLDFDVAYTALEGSKFGEATPVGQLADMAQHLPVDMALVALWKLDLAAWFDTVGKMSAELAAGLPDKERAQLEVQMARSREFVKQLGDEWMVGLDVNDGFRVVCALQADDANGLVAKYAELMLGDGLAGAKVVDEGSREVEGVDVRRLRLTLDLEKLKVLNRIDKPMSVDAMHKIVGDDGIVLDLAAKGDNFVLVVDGKGELMGEVLAASAVPAGVQQALDHIGGDVRFLMHLDMRAHITGLSKLSAKAPAVAEGGPLPITIYRTNEGRVYRGGMRVQFAEMAAFLKTLKR